MDDWHDYLDYVSNERVLFFSEQELGCSESYAEQEINLIDSRTECCLKIDAAKYIVCDDRCAIEFLRLISSGELDFFKQQSILNVLAELHGSCYGRKKRSALVRYELTKALDLLPDSVLRSAARFNTELEISDENYSFHAQFGNGESAVLYGLSVARSVGFKAFIGAFAARFSAFEKPGDLVGEWKLVASNIKYPELAKHLPGIYGLNAEVEIKKVSHRTAWEIKFLHFPPIDRTWYSLEKAAYEAAAPVVAKAIHADVVAVGTLWD